MVGMKQLLLMLAVVVLILGAACSKDEGTTAPSGTTMDKATDAAKDTATQSQTFACSTPNCDKEKTGTMAEPPS